MAEGDGLGALQVSVAGHDGGGVLTGLFADHLDELHDVALQHVAVVPQRQADIQRHLIVAAAAGVQALARVADAGGEGLLHKGVHILGVGVDLQCAGSQVVGDGSQTVEDILAVLFGDDALLGQHGGVDAAAAHILRDHALVKADGGVEVVDAAVHRLGKPTLPELFCHSFVLLLLGGSPSPSLLAQCHLSQGERQETWRSCSWLSLWESWTRSGLRGRGCYSL